MKYLSLFSLELLHEYYSNRRCSDFEIEATPETQKLLKNYRCNLKPLPNGVRVLTMGNGTNSPFIPLPEKVTFGFQLRLQDPNFILFTDFSELDLAAAPLYTNTTNPELKLISREANVTESFLVRQTSKKETFVLSGRPLGGVPLTAFHVNGLGTAVSLVAYDEETKIASVNSGSVKAGAAFTITYPTTPQLKRGVFADVEIQYDSSMAGGVHPFQIVFKAKKMRWKYYIVTNKTDNKTSLPTIEDKDKTIVFDTAGRTDLTQSPDLSDKIAGELSERYPNMQTFRFLSDALIPCQEAARRSIQFQLNGDKVVEALPNPALQNYVIDVRDSKTEDSLYHIVKYFTH